MASVTTDLTKAGEPPQERWPDILDNARKKAAAEEAQKWGWAAEIPEPHRDTVRQWYRLLDQSPVDALDLLFQQAAQHPDHSPKLRSWLGRVLGTRGSAQPSEAALPEPDFQDEASGAQFYSAARMAEYGQAIERRITAALEKKFGHLDADWRTRQAEGLKADAKAEAARWADTEYARMQKTYPHFAAHQQAIVEAMTKDETLSAQDAYIQVVVPKLSQLERTEVVTSLQQKATAGGIDTSKASGSALPPPKTMKEAFERLPASALR